MKSFKEYLRESTQEYPEAILVTPNPGMILLYVRVKDDKYSCKYIKSVNKDRWYKSAYYGDNPNNWVSYTPLISDPKEISKIMDKDEYEQFVFTEIF